MTHLSIPALDIWETLPLSRGLALCRAAGRAALAIYRARELCVNTKADDSPVTLADKESHRILCEGLADLDSRPVISEEGDIPPWRVRQSWREYWLIDPLDGTKEFIKGNGEFTINIALIRDGEPVFGIVYVPVTDVFYFGGKGRGAFRQDGLDITRRSIRCAGVPTADDQWRVLGSRSHPSAQLAEFLVRLPRHQLKSVGSSLKLCLIAEGEADLYPRFGPTSEWDTAAGQAVLEAAGGQVLDWSTLSPLRYNTKESLLNPSFIACAGISSAWSGETPHTAQLPNPGAQ